MESRSVYESLKQTSEAADQAVRIALDIAEKPRGLSVVALGRLGTNEFDVISDADLIFIRDASLNSRTASRAAESVMETLSAYTSEGNVFVVDARLRPHGNDGELTNTTEQLIKYFETEAQTWEALTWCKVRWVAGSKSVAKKLSTSLETMQKRFASLPEFSRQARQMRRRLEQSDEEELNLKTGPGGLYDIDFILSYLAITHAIGELTGNLQQRLELLSSKKLLSPADAQILINAARFLRTVEHAIRLVTGRTAKTLPVAEASRQITEDIAARILGKDMDGGIENCLRATQSQVREIYARVLSE